MKNESQWVSIKETKKYPKEEETVWLYNAKDKCVWLGCLVYTREEGFNWVILNGGDIYAENGKIVAECDGDDIEVTHWCELPLLPL